jgi:alanine dehydrogenase
MVPIILDLGNAGGVDQLLKRDYGVRQGVYIYNGTITSLAISRNFNLPFQDMDLLMAAFH